MAMFKKSLNGILAGFNRTIKALEEFEMAQRVEINKNLEWAGQLRNRAEEHDQEINRLEGERMQALSIKEKIAGLVA